MYIVPRGLVYSKPGYNLSALSPGSLRPLKVDRKRYQGHIFSWKLPSQPPLTNIERRRGQHQSSPQCIAACALKALVQTSMCFDHCNRAIWI